MQTLSRALSRATETRRKHHQPAQGRPAGAPAREHSEHCRHGRGGPPTQRGSGQRPYGIYHEMPPRPPPRHRRTTTSCLAPTVPLLPLDELTIVPDKLYTELIRSYGRPLDRWVNSYKIYPRPDIGSPS